MTIDKAKDLGITLAGNYHLDVAKLLAEIERLATESREAKDAKLGLSWAINELRGSFKNFHRSMCARFGYTHDEKEWFRDRVSLEEHAAGQISQLQAEIESLRKDAERYRFLRDGSDERVQVIRHHELHIKFLAGKDVDAEVDAAMAKEASHG